MKRLPPLTALRAFDAAVRTSSFTRAGESLHVTQGAISRQIKLLEDWLGKPVFVRHYQGLTLTPAGSLLAQSLDAAFGTIQDAVEQIGYLGARQRISVNVPETFASRWLAPRLRAFHGRHPDIDLTITTNAVGNQREAQQYDCLVLFLDQPWTKGDCRLLRQEQYVAVASPELWQDGLAPTLDKLTLLHVLAGNKRLPLWENWLASLGIRHIDAPTQSRRHHRRKAEHRRCPLHGHLASQGVQSPQYRARSTRPVTRRPRAEPTPRPGVGQGSRRP